MAYYRPRKNVREGTAGFIQSLDILLNDACQAANYDTPVICKKDNVTVKAPHLIPSIVGPRVVHTKCTHDSSSSSTDAKRKSHEAFDHDAVSNFLSYGAWNDLLPKNDDGSDSVTLDDFALNTAAATLGLGPIPSVPTESPHATSPGRAHKAHNRAVTHRPSDTFRPTMNHSPDEKSNHALAQRLGDECVDSDAACVATHGASADQPSSPPPSSTNSSLAPEEPIDIDCAVSHPSKSSFLPAAAVSSRRTMRGAASKDLKHLNSFSSNVRYSTKNEESSDEEAITGLASAYQDYADANGTSVGASSDCIALAITGILA